ncbi:MAG TPA: hypothetical protein VFT91_03525, partial [Dehalococcoidia bacterium]|nr:hypothetical protein [Dehalococcoidia bacterium]
VAVPGAEVHASWTLPNGTERDQVATTGVSGVAGFSVRSGRGTYTLSVSDIVKPGYTFDPIGSVLTKSITR